MTAIEHSFERQRLQYEVSNLRTTIVALERSRSTLHRDVSDDGCFKVNATSVLNDMSLGYPQQITQALDIKKDPTQLSGTSTVSYRLSCIAVGVPRYSNSHDDGGYDAYDDPQCDPYTRSHGPNWPLSSTIEPCSFPHTNTIKAHAGARSIRVSHSLTAYAGDVVQHRKAETFRHTKQSASCDSPTSFHQYFQCPRSPPKVPQSQELQTCFRPLEKRSHGLEPPASFDSGKADLKRAYSLNDSHGQKLGGLGRTRSTSKRNAIRASMNKDLPDPSNQRKDYPLHRVPLTHLPDLDGLLHDLRMANMSVSIATTTVS